MTTFEEMWNHPMRNLARIETHFGEAGLRNLISNLSKSVVISLYSGLGGAEAGIVNCMVAHIDTID